MSTTLHHLRCSLIGLIGFAAAEEELLLGAAGASTTASRGTPEDWAALPLIAHISEFRRQQVERLASIRAGRTPPTYAEIDHRSVDVYSRYAAISAEQVAREHRQVSDDAVSNLQDAVDLNEDRRNQGGRRP